MKKRYGFMIMMAGILVGAHGAQAAPPVVLELFTSQGCSSCPAADALMGRMAQDPGLLPLLFHVSYWNSLGWKDPYASAETTGRQYAYAKALGAGNSVFTPQLVVNGTESMVGSDAWKLRKAIAAANDKISPVRAALKPDPSGKLNLSLSGIDLKKTDIWEVRFISHATTPVGAGENGGRTLESVNNVTSIKQLADMVGEDGSFTLPPLRAPDNGLAVIVQEPGPGRILGSAVYMKQ
jgi:hypothetical protein